MAAKKQKKLFKAIEIVRDHLHDEYICSRCYGDESFGCASCDAIDLDKRLRLIRDAAKQFEWLA